MKTWLVKDARARFGDVISGALAGEPQRIARRGREAVVVVSEEEWERSCGRPPQKSLAQLVAEFPLTPEEWEEVRPRREPFKPSFSFDD